ncbi:MAG: GlxA family transcriptional regulator [Myxococcota bacterium]
MDVLFAAFPQCCALDIVGPMEVLSTANIIAGRDLYRCRIAGIHRGPIATESGLMMHAETELDTDAHTIVVSGGVGYRDLLDNEAFTTAIAKSVERFKRLTSVCTGSFLLAQTGCLNGRRATTHWAYVDEFKGRFPNVTLVADELYVADGPFITAAGVAAGIDMALALVAQDHGDELARRVSRRMVVYLNRSGGQSQFSERIEPSKKMDDALAALLSDIVAQPCTDHSVAALAARAHMSERSFARHFKAATGTTPARWVERVRVDHARRLLESTSIPMSEVACRSGFGADATMRQAFDRVVGVSPTHYRRSHTSQTSRTAVETKRSST